MGEQAAAQGAARVRQRKILRAEAPGLQQGNRQCIAQGERGGGAGGRRQIVRAGFAGDAGIEDNVGFAGQRWNRVLPVRAMTRVPQSTQDAAEWRSSSSASPEYDRARKTSSPVIMPRSPWLASAGCTK